MKRTYYNIKTYIEHENYKDDKGVLGKVYADSVKIHYLAIFHTIEEMSNRASELADEAELITLK